MTDLFTPIVIGDLTLKNRIFMAPLTRMRSQQPGNIPYELNAEYYDPDRKIYKKIDKENLDVTTFSTGFAKTEIEYCKRRIKS